MAINMDNEETDGGVEMVCLNEGGEESSKDFEDVPAVRRPNYCFGFGFLSCLAAAATIYFVAGFYASPSFTTGSVGGGDYDSGAGEVGLNAHNAKTQAMANEEAEGNVGTKKHKWWNRDHHMGQGGDLNYSRWKEHPNVSKDKLEKLQNFLISNRTKDGMCTLANGRSVPCPTNTQPIDDPATKTSNNAIANAQKSSYTKITLEDGKKYDVIEQLKHDRTSFTQGLTFANGKLFESTGLYGQSKVRQLDANTGDVIKSVNMQSKYFGEGMAFFDENKLIQITWKRQKGFIYDSETLDVIDEFKFSTTKNEGWGITFDPSDRTFIVSDGSSYLHFWDADKPGIPKKDRPKVEVLRHNGKPAVNMNELELVNGKVIANVWYQDVLLVIDPRTGVCEKEYNFSDLWPKRERRGELADVLNGVSVSGEEGVLFVTGKKWNRMYKIKLQGMDDLEENS